MRTLVHRTRALLLVCACSLFSIASTAQSITAGDGKFEIGLGVGPMIFLGDLGGNYGKGKTFLKDVNFPLTKISKGLFLSCYPAEWLGFRIAVNHSRVDGYDSIINDKGSAETFRYQRNLQFRSSLSEAYVAAEIYPTVFFEQFTGNSSKLRPYGIAGIGIFHFNPQGQYIATDGTRSWVDLQPLRLEGQGMAEYPDRKPYALTQIHLPMGFGFKYFFSPNKYIGLEILHRKTFTDYVDDVSTNYIDGNLFNNYLSSSQAEMARQLHYRENLANSSSRTRTPDLNEQRGNPKQNDAFFSSMLRFGWRFPDKSSMERRASRQLRCPIF